MRYVRPFEELLKFYEDTANNVTFELTRYTNVLGEIYYMVNHYEDEELFNSNEFKTYEEALDVFTDELIDYLSDEEESEGDSILIQDLELSARAANCLLRAGLRTLSDIKDLTKFQLRRIRNLGVKSLEEIEEVVKEYGYELKEI